MPYSPDRTPLGYDALPDWDNVPDDVGSPLAAIPHKADDGPGSVDHRRLALHRYERWAPPTTYAKNRRKTC
jgi:hypothetical protein